MDKDVLKIIITHLKGIIAALERDLNNVEVDIYIENKRKIKEMTFTEVK